MGRYEVTIMLKHELKKLCEELEQQNNQLKIENDRQHRIIKDKEKEVDNTSREVKRLTNILRTIHCRSETALRVFYPKRPVRHSTVTEVSNEKEPLNDVFKNFLEIISDDSLIREINDDLRRLYL